MSVKSFDHFVHAIYSLSHPLGWDGGGGGMGGGGADVFFIYAFHIKIKSNSFPLGLFDPNYIVMLSHYLRSQKPWEGNPYFVSALKYRRVFSSHEIGSKDRRRL